MTNDRKKKAVLKLINAAFVYALLAMAGGVSTVNLRSLTGFPEGRRWPSCTRTYSCWE